MSEAVRIQKIDGGVTAAKGFEAASAAAGIKYQGRDDMALIYSETPCRAAGTFTTNVVKAAPVKWDQKIVAESPYVQAVIVNSGIANACTGAEGYGYCEETAKEAAKVPGRKATGTVRRPRKRRQRSSAYRRTRCLWRPPGSSACSFPWTG